MSVASILAALAPAGACNDGGRSDDGGTTSSSGGTAASSSDGTADGTTEGTSGTSEDDAGPTSEPTGTGETTGDGQQCGDGSNDAGALCFAPPIEVLVGVPVAAILAAELFDGGDDLVVGHSAGITVLVGDGRGGLVAQDELDVGSVVALALGDLDGDGLPDIAAAHGGDGRVSISLGAAGQFVASEDLPLDVVPAASPSSVAIADFDQDGQADIVAVDESAARLHLWLQGPGGSFAAPLTLDIGGSPGDIAVGSFGGSAAPDVAVPNLGGTSVAILLAAAGSFDIADSVVVGAGPRAVWAGDLDGDGRDDLVTADGAADTASIAYGGASGFNPAVGYVAGPQPRGVVGGDIDNDGQPDAVVSLESANAVAVFLQGEGGAFAAAQWVATPPQPGGLALADFNGDGLGDLAVASAAAPGGVSLLLSDP